MSLLILAYPRLDLADYNFIQSYRKLNDELYFTVVEPHFTIVFPFETDDVDSFIDEAIKQSKSINKFRFELKCATVNKDAFKEIYHTFLVPDEGYAAIVRAHDKFYSGMFAQQLKYDIDFIPHIGIGNSKNYLDCKKMVEEWNNSGFSIKGSIESFAVIDYTDNKVTKLEEIHLN